MDSTARFLFRVCSKIGFLFYSIFIYRNAAHKQNNTKRSTRYGCSFSLRTDLFNVGGDVILDAQTGDFKGELQIGEITLPNLDTVIRRIAAPF